MQLNQEWYPASELAGLPGQPGSVRAVQLKAKREAWHNHKRHGRGGGVEYHLDSLPAATRDAILDRLIEALPGKSCPLPTATETVITELQKQTLPQEVNLANWQRRTMEARLAILHEVERLTAVSSANKAIGKIVQRAQAGTLPDHLQQLVPIANAKSGGGAGKQTLSVPTLKRWRGALQKFGTIALAPKEPKRRAMPQWGPTLLKVWRQPQKPPLTEAVRQLRAQGIDINYAAADRFLKKIGEVEKNKGRMGPRELKNIKPFRRRDTRNLMPGDIYAADGHTFDAEVAHPDHGQPFRPEITLIIDVATRCIAGWSVGLAESHLATLDALRHACETSGVPAIFYTDNGSGYCNEIMTAPGTGLLARLGIEHSTSIPYNSQARGIIERAHRTILVNLASRLPTYIGAPMDPQAKQAAFKETRRSEKKLLLPWADFIRLVEAAIAEYHNRPHRGLEKVRDPDTRKQRHLTPAEYWQKFQTQGWEPTPAGELPDLYHPQVARKVQRGEINLYNNRYYSSDLTQHHGDAVFVAYNVHDPEKVWIRDHEQRLICIAELDGNSSDFMPMSFVEQAREKRADGRIRRLDRKRQEIEAERRGGAVEVEATISEDERIEIRQRLQLEMKSNVFHVPHDDQGKYRLWQQLHATIENGVSIGESALRFHQAFMNTPIFKAFRTVEKDLGVVQA